MIQKTIQLSKETYHYREQGSGSTTLLLLHGNMSSGLHYDMLMKRLPPEIRVIAPDLRGFGHSSYNHSFSSLDELASDVAEFAKALNIKHCVLAGWSTGGGIALKLAAQEPELVQKLILIESVGIFGYPMFKKDALGKAILTERLSHREDIAADPVQVLPILDAYKTKNTAILRKIWEAMIYTQSKPDETTYTAYLNDMLLQRNLVDIDYSLAHFNVSNANNGISEGTGEISAVKMPAIVFQGKRDLVVPYAWGETLKNTLPNLTAFYDGDWGHSPITDCPDFLAEKIKEFVLA